MFVVHDDKSEERILLIQLGYCLRRLSLLGCINNFLSSVVNVLMGRHQFLLLKVSKKKIKIKKGSTGKANIEILSPLYHLTSGEK